MADQPVVPPTDPNAAPPAATSPTEAPSSPAPDPSAAPTPPPAPMDGAPVPAPAGSSKTRSIILFVILGILIVVAVIYFWNNSQ